MTDQVLHEVINTGDSTLYQFYHNGIEYVIWLELSSGNAYQMRLSEVKQNGSYYYPDSKVTMTAYGSAIQNVGGTREFLNTKFLPKVNEYLLAQGEPEMDSFPEDANETQQLLWLVENALSYVDGQVILNV